MTSYLQQQHFHSGLLADASWKLQSFRPNQRNELHSIFTALHTKVSSGTKNTFQNVDIILKFMTEFE